MTIVEFLQARLDEDEAAARRATPGPWVHGHVAVEVEVGGMTWQRLDEDDEHVIRHDPARALREVEAIRGALHLLQQFEDMAWSGSYVVRDQARDVAKALSWTYSDHPDYPQGRQP